MYITLAQRAPSHKFSESPSLTEGVDTLHCTIYLPAHAGARSSYHYELLKRFAHSNHYALRYVPVTDSDQIWEQLLSHRTDILVLNIIHDSIPKEVFKQVFLTPSITEMGEVWISAKNKSPWRLEIVHWLTLFQQRKDFPRFKNRFLPASANRCPYDSLLRATARPLGWDWKIFRSVMYQESRYGMNAQSARNATGLMQMKLSTAQDMNLDDIDNLFDPEQNIRCAIKYFSYIQRNMHLEDLPETERVNFVLAAYNAGLGRIQNDREKALEEGKNPDKWEDVAPYTPNQTQQYVKSIWVRYHNWSTSSE